MPHPFSLLRHLLLSLLLLFPLGELQAQTDSLRQVGVSIIKNYFDNYTAKDYRPYNPMKSESVEADTLRQVWRVVVNESFASQKLTPEVLKNIRQSVKNLLPLEMKDWEIELFSNKGKRLEDLIPNELRDGKKDESRLWNKTDHTGRPWVQNVSRPYKISRGLDGRHLFIWPSHGIYYKEGIWKWQRPALYCTREDLLTQSFVYPFLFPMLENAGAVVGCPRERDIQPLMALVDNDASAGVNGKYRETSARHATAWKTPEEVKGFKAPEAEMTDTVFPFSEGTCRMAQTQSDTEDVSRVEWIPNIPEAGKYAVYVSYSSLPQSVDDAHYSVFHRGGRTDFLVNQQMGGGTWTYLGTFDFAPGTSEQGKVVLTNESRHRGVVTADAVRFGGGMSQHVRGGAATTSCKPRFLEAARYHNAFSGIPNSLVNTSEGTNDYADDLRTRGRSLNFLSGSSAFQPGIDGAGIPFELSLALHTDAGVRNDLSVYGSLSISTTTCPDGTEFFPSGVSRMASLDFSTLLLNNLSEDLTKKFGVNWTRRESWDRNYAETRIPDVPSAILELLSHQNFTDMRYAHDPHFKFWAARSIYKTILRTVAAMHGKHNSVIQPLPPQQFSALFSPNEEEIILNWQPQPDEEEPSAMPQAYVLYTSVNGSGFDNGKNIGHATEYRFTPEADKLYAFRVTAVNEGGESFPSETLTAYKSPKPDAPRVLLVNNFTRLSGPKYVQNTDSLGFLLDKDYGVPYLYNTSFCGRQQNFSPHLSVHSNAGESGDELIGMVFGGNTFDYPLRHAAYVLGEGNRYKEFSFCSTSTDAFCQLHSLSDYRVIDWICGQQHDSPQNLVPAPIFNEKTEAQLSRYLAGGGSLLLSGNYLGRDASQNEVHREFAENKLKYVLGGTLPTDSLSSIQGLGTEIHLRQVPDRNHYKPQSLDILNPAGEGTFTPLIYNNGRSAAIAHKPRSGGQVVALGFPIEAVATDKEKSLLLRSLIHFLAQP